jgi:hypothetical protein
MTRTALLVFALLLPSSMVAQFPFIEIDPSDGTPVLVNGGLAGIYNDDGLEPAILVARGEVSDMYIGSGGVRLFSQTFPKDGIYRVRLFSHYHSREFCKSAASIQLKPEYVSKCAAVGYRFCDLTVDTHERKFSFGRPWPCLFLDRTGAPLMGIGKPGFLPEGWVTFDSLAKTKERGFLQVIDGITKIVGEYGHGY